MEEIDFLGKKKNILRKNTIQVGNKKKNFISTDEKIPILGDQNI